MNNYDNMSSAKQKGSSTGLYAHIDLDCKAQIAGQIVVSFTWVVWATEWLTPAIVEETICPLFKLEMNKPQ